MSFSHRKCIIVIEMMIIADGSIGKAIIQSFSLSIFIVSDHHFRFPPGKLMEKKKRKKKKNHSNNGAE